MNTLANFLESESPRCNSKHVIAVEFWAALNLLSLSAEAFYLIFIVSYITSFVTSHSAVFCTQFATLNQRLLLWYQCWLGSPWLVSNTIVHLHQWLFAWCSYNVCQKVCAVVNSKWGIAFFVAIIDLTIRRDCKFVHLFIY